MDWKSWYRTEVESARGRALIASAIDRFPAGDPTLRHALKSGGAASFPHTTLVDSAEPLARVATSILAERFDRVVALGVLHGSTLPEPERSLAPAAARGDPSALERVGGAFFSVEDAATPFGTVPAGPSPPEGRWFRRGDRILENEFSLDLFLSVLAAAASARRAPLPSVTRVFVGPGNAGAVAASIRPLLGPGVALVATGDLVHAGHGYAPDAEVAALPAGEAALLAHFEAKASEMLRLGFSGPADSVAADEIARAIRSDQRHVMPVLSALLGPGACAALLLFRLTDYAAILGRPSPCVVGSSLVAIRAAGTAAP